MSRYGANREILRKPEVDDNYILKVFLDILKIHTHDIKLENIRDWESVNGPKLLPWEINALLRAGKEYTKQLHISRDHLALDPLLTDLERETEIAKIKRDSFGKK